MGTLARKRHRTAVTLPWEQGLGASLLADGVSRLRFALALLAAGALVWAVASRTVARNREAETLAAIGVAHRAVLAFRDREGRCPASLDELMHPPSPGARYLRKVPRDAWGQTLRIRCAGSGTADQIEVTSAGPDGSFDDIHNLR